MAKQTLFYDACNNFARMFLEMMERCAVIDLYDEEIHDGWLIRTINDMIDADREDLIHSYGILRAITVYYETHGAEMLMDLDDGLENSSFIANVLYRVMREPVLERVKGLLGGQKCTIFMPCGKSFGGNPSEADTKAMLHRNYCETCSSVLYRLSGVATAEQASETLRQALHLSEEKD